jgi:tungstate transport system permease protein
MMLGGNIRMYTRTITTAIALETSKGDFALGLALGIILMIVAFGVNTLMHLVVKHE